MKSEKFLDKEEFSLLLRSSVDESRVGKATLSGCYPFKHGRFFETKPKTLLSKEEFSLLCSLSLKRRVLEVGCFRGYLSEVLSGVANELTCVDVFAQDDITYGDPVSGKLYSWRPFELLRATKARIILNKSDSFDEIAEGLDHFDVIIIDLPAPLILPAYRSFYSKLDGRGLMFIHDRVAYKLNPALFDNSFVVAESSNGFLLRNF